MILDYEFSQFRKKMMISYIKEDGQKDIFEIPNITRFKQFYFTPNGKYDAWDGSKCDIRWTEKPSKFDLMYFMNELPEQYRKQLGLTTFPKLYTFDIENEFDPGSDAQENAKKGARPITTISIVSPGFSAAVLGTKPMTADEIKYVEDNFYKYLDSIEFFHELKDVQPKFKYLYFETEEAMLEFFLTKFVAKVPILAGWNSILYDWQYIVNRIKNYFPNLSITMASCTKTTKNKRFQDLKEDFYTLPMPCHTLILDYMQVIRDEDKTVLPMKESLSLDYVSYETLKANKIEYDGDLEQLRKSDYKKYVFYNTIDSILVQLLNYRFRTMDHIYVFSIYCKERIGDCFSKIACSEALCFNNFYNRKIYVPYVEQERGERGRVQGAYVKQPIPGKWNYVSCNDFASLYPSTMRTCNLSFENYVGVFHDEKKLAPYKADKKNYLVIESSVFRNEGTVEHPEAGEFIGTFILDDKLEPYRKNPNYFVSLNGTVYKNDKDYCLKLVETYLYDQRNINKYLAKDLDAFVITDIDHILGNKTNKLFTYKDNIVELLKKIGVNDVVCGKDFMHYSADELKSIKHKIEESIEYSVTLEQSIKILMNSIYGGSSHVSNYWFNIHLAGDITGESRNLTHYMEKHFATFWNENWANMTDWHKKWGIEVDFDSIQPVIDESPTKSLVTTVYGDTDSLYISYDPLLKTIKGHENMTDLDVCNFIAKLNEDFLNKHNEDYIRDYYNKRHGKSVHKFELETICKSGIWLNIKKRYAQIIMWKDGKIYDADKMPLKAKGLEIVKSSIPSYARGILKHIVRFLLESDDKYLIQKLNIEAQRLKQEFMKADIDAICGSLNVHNYVKYVQDDKGPVLKFASKTPANVKALAYYNWLNNRNNLGSDAIYGGKLKWYIVETGVRSKKDDIRFAYQARNYPKWASQYAPVNRNAMFQLFVLDPFNRILEAIRMPILNNDGSMQQSLFG